MMGKKGKKKTVPAFEVGECVLAPLHVGLGVLTRRRMTAGLVVAVDGDLLAIRTVRGDLVFPLAATVERANGAMAALIAEAVENDGA